MYMKSTQVRNRARVIRMCQMRSRLMVIRTCLIEYKNGLMENRSWYENMQLKDECTCNRLKLEIRPTVTSEGHFTQWKERTRVFQNKRIYTDF